MKKLFLKITILVVLFLIPKMVFGNVVINEIMYDLPGPDGIDSQHTHSREWIEIKNISTDEVDLKNWKFNDGSNHILNEPPKNGGQGSLIIPPGEYAILSDMADIFLQDHPGFSGTVIDTVMNLGQQKDTTYILKILDPENAPIDVVSYNISLGANGNGRSLQRENPNGTTWGSGNPTPGALNNISPEEPTSTSEESTPEQPEPPLMPTGTNNPPIADAGDNIIGFVNQEIEFDGTQSSDPDNDELAYAWNMGDGKLIEKPEFSYKYMYPGTYLVTLMVYDGQYYVLDTITVKIQAGQITINEFLPSPDGTDEENEWIEIYNDSGEIVNISDWQLDDATSGSAAFMFPENTLIAPKSYLVFSRQITGIALNNDKDSVRLLLPEGVVFQEINYEKPMTGKSSARSAEGFVWATPTPGMANIINPSNASGLINKNFVYQQPIKPETTKQSSEDYVINYQNANQPEIEGGYETITKTDELASVKPISSNSNLINLILLILAIIFGSAFIGLLLIKFRKKFT